MSATIKRKRAHHSDFVWTFVYNSTFTTTCSTRGCCRSLYAVAVRIIKHCVCVDVFVDPFLRVYKYMCVCVWEYCLRCFFKTGDYLWRAYVTGPVRNCSLQLSMDTVMGNSTICSISTPPQLPSSSSLEEKIREREVHVFVKEGRKTNECVAERIISSLLFFVFLQKCRHLTQTRVRPNGYVHTYLPTYLHTYIPTYLPTYIHTYLHTYIHTVDLYWTPEWMFF